MKDTKEEITFLVKVPYLQKYGDISKSTMKKIRKELRIQANKLLLSYMPIMEKEEKITPRCWWCGDDEVPHIAWADVNHGSWTNSFQGPWWRLRRACSIHSQQKWGIVPTYCRPFNAGETIECHDPTALRRFKDVKYWRS